MGGALPEPILDRDSIDAILNRLRLGQVKVSAGLVELDRHPVVQLLRDSPLQAKTRQRWVTAEAQLADLWVSYRTCRDGLSRVEQLRGRRNRPGRTDLLKSPDC
ncbi:hypothetical protein ACN27F_29785 [Solwaraspora sp. WMMB335]|uniref:hypothetical protein n=1 Tax=Solwaraspora sp. WMMB335 TaxID=3404118 RepID=UPI003B93A21B